METQDTLLDRLRRIDGCSYGAYKRLLGRYVFPGDLTLSIDRVQADPFAPPSRLRLRVSQKRSAFPQELFADRHRRRGLSHHLATAFAAAATHYRSQRPGTGNSGFIEIDAPGQQMLARSCIDVGDEFVEARFSVGLPAARRRILGDAAATLLLEALPTIAASSLLFKSCDGDAAARCADGCEDAVFLRAALAERGLVAFVADGAQLARHSGIDDGPLKGPAVVPFSSPESLRVKFDLPRAGEVSGMGIPAGVTLIAGGSFHGKSTLIKAIALGVYDHVPGDGRELVITDDSAVLVRAEDGRHVAGVDLTPFIDHLPGGHTTASFTTNNASGSTSQAAAIIEALEAGCNLLLIDEDTAATNFMSRDGRMQQLIGCTREPITPYIDRVRELADDVNVSTILVTGGSGDYFSVANTVIAMDHYVPQDVTKRAREIDRVSGNNRSRETTAPFDPQLSRAPKPESLKRTRNDERRAPRCRGRNIISIGDQTVDLSSVEQLVHASQTRAIGAALVFAAERLFDGHPLSEILDYIDDDIARLGLDALSPEKVGDLADFRRFELAAAINRLRSLVVEPATAGPLACDPESPVILERNS